MRFGFRVPYAVRLPAHCWYTNTFTSSSDFAPGWTLGVILLAVLLLISNLLPIQLLFPSFTQFPSNFGRQCSYIFFSLFLRLSYLRTTQVSTQGIAGLTL